VVVRNNSHPQTLTSAVAVCNPGERATGGGGAPSSPGATLVSSMPYVFAGSTYSVAIDGQTPNAWGVETTTGSPAVWVICASP
jgi:hypothetical protein